MNADNNFPEANSELGPPESWNEGDCNSLKIWRGVEMLPNGTLTPLITSKFIPTKEELEALNRGEGIYLTICDTLHPPVRLEVGSPIKTYQAEIDTLLFPLGVKEIRIWGQLVCNTLVTMESLEMFVNYLNWIVQNNFIAFTYVMGVPASYIQYRGVCSLPIQVDERMFEFVEVVGPVLPEVLDKPKNTPGFGDGC